MKDGGSDSGNFGHAGVPGQVGGSASGSGSSSEASENSSTENVVSDQGSNIPCTGFASKKKLKSHAKRHASGVGATSAKDYEQKAIDFLCKPCTGDIIGYATKSGKVVRFNQKTCEYASGIPGKEVKTYMNPKTDKKTGASRPLQALQYYNDFKDKDDI